MLLLLPAKILYKKNLIFFEDFNPTGKTPYEFEFNDETLNVNSWISILEIICKYLYESNSDLFTALSKHQDFNNKSYFASNAEVLRAPFQLNQNLYIEKNFSAKDILRYSKLLLEKFDYDWDSNCIIRIK